MLYLLHWQYIQQVEIKASMKGGKKPRQYNGRKCGTPSSTVLIEWTQWHYIGYCTGDGCGEAERGGRERQQYDVSYPGDQPR